jgi:quinol monooxygenase YgiN
MEPGSLPAFSARGCADLRNSSTSRSLPGLLSTNAQIASFAMMRPFREIGCTENGTLTWYAVKIAPSKYAIFDTFAAESGRQAHLTGAIAKALFAKAKDLFAKDPEVHKLDVLAAKAHLADGKQKSAHS